MQKNIKQQPAANKNISADHKNEKSNKQARTADKMKTSDSKGKVSRHPTTEPNPEG